MRISNYILSEGTNVNASFDSSSIDMEQQIGLSVQVDFASTTCSASIMLQASNDGLTWSNLSSSITVNNNSGTSMLYSNDYFYRYARVKVTVNSGSMTSLKMRVYSKGL